MRPIRYTDQFENNRIVLQLEFSLDCSTILASVFNGRKALSIGIPINNEQSTKSQGSAGSTVLRCQAQAAMRYAIMQAESDRRLLVHIFSLKLRGASMQGNF